jgi:hypothetical protein
MFPMPGFFRPSLCPGVKTMKSIVFALLLGCTSGHADDVSGPNRTTIQGFPWGSIYYEPGVVWANELESTNNGFKFRSKFGEVEIKTTNANSYRLTWGQESLTINQNIGDLEIREKGKIWTLRMQNGRCTLTCSSPRESLVFDRTLESFSVTGNQGRVSVSREMGTLSITSPVGTAKVVTDTGKRTISGVPIDQIPYLGRGLFIPFHGVGIFIDVTKQFPMREVVEWVEWKPLLNFAQ